MPIYTESKSILINPDTGEILGLWDEPQVLTVRTKESYLQAKSYADQSNKSRSDVFLKPSKEKQIHGDFIWTLFDTSQILFPDIKPATLSRLMMLSTYMNYCNLLMYNDKPMTLEDMEGILNISKRMAWYTIDELISGGILIKGDIFKLNKQLFLRGHIDNKEIGILYGNSRAIKRLYVKGVRALYNTACSGSVKKLSYIFRIMPFVNQEYNIICSNPLEKNKYKIQPLSLGELAEIIGYGKTNSYRLQHQLLDPTFDAGNGPTKAVRYVSGDSVGIENHCLFINPEIYYGGSSFEEVAILGQFK